MMVTAIIFGILVVYGAVLVLFWRYIETLEEQTAKWEKDALDLTKDMYQTMEKWVEEETIMIAKLNGIKEKEAGNE